MSKRVMEVADLTGQRRGRLLILGLASRHPPRWRVRCTNPDCRAETVVDHARLQNGAVADCPNPQCQRPTLIRRPPPLTDTRVPAVRSRDSESARQYEAEQAEKQREQAKQSKEREDAERRSRQKRGHQAFMREGILSGPDSRAIVERVFEDDNSALKRDDADSYSREQGKLFRQTHPDYFPCAENLAVITAYLERNAPHLKRVSAEQLAFVYRRLNEFGLLKQAPEPEPDPVPEPVPESEPEPKPICYEGYDLETGELRSYTRREVEQMSSDTFRRVFRIYAEHLRPPNVGPGPRARNTV